MKSPNFSARQTVFKIKTIFSSLLFQLTFCFILLSSNATADGFSTLIPKPVISKKTSGHFNITQHTVLLINSSQPELIDLAQNFALSLRPATGFKFPIIQNDSSSTKSFISFNLHRQQSYGKEGYTLDIMGSGISLTAQTLTGLFRATQTLRQMLGSKVEASKKQEGPWSISQGHIVDYPRMDYRGFMLDVSRHFYSVSEIKSILDQMAFYKFNVFHFHLTDDQGWRIEIPSWPRLTTIGSRSAVNQTDCESCFYTLEEFEDIIAYAEKRHITVIPEIDTPGHIRAAMASYPDELYCDGEAPDWPYTSMKVQISSLCFSNPKIYEFFNDVIATIAPRINGDYIHVGGDETPKWVKHEDYQTFMLKAKSIITKYNKKMIGWTDDLGSVKNLGSDVIGQHWAIASTCCETTLSIVKQGGKILMSPANKTYLSLKYNEKSPFGGAFAGYNDTKNTYLWDPITIVPGAGKKDVIGIEAALWGERIKNISDAQFMIFPRLISISEVGWSPQLDRNWDEFKIRLGFHGPRLERMGVNFYRSPLVPWK